MTAAVPAVDGHRIRPVRADDRDAVLDLLAAALGWVPDADARAYFSWKHDQNPFGASPAWVAESTDGDGRLLGFRTFLRWEFVRPDGSVVRAVRAVDTATHPDAAGRGIFRQLTTSALAELAGEGVDLVFNTPNSKSRPGYLKMGWADVGRIPTSVRPAGVGALVRMLRSRTAADRWSVPTEAALDAVDVLADPRVADLVASQTSGPGLRTNLTADVLRWRYGFPHLRYRAVLLADDPAEGLAVFRLRRRGAAVEAALCVALAPGGDPHVQRRLAVAVASASRADYVIRFGGPPVGLDRYLRLPGQGPPLTWRPTSGPAADEPTPRFDLALGDIELF